MNSRRLAATFGFAALVATTAVRAQTPIPESPTRWVNDQVGFLSTAVRNELELKLAEYARTTGHQVIVYIGLTTGGVPIEDWAVKAFERWKVGRQGIDDGLVLFVFSADRQLRIEVGYGLEPTMTDARAAQIIRDVIVPRIKQGERDAAIRTGIEAILTTLDSAGNAPLPVASGMSKADKRTLWIVALGFLGIPVLLFVVIGLLVFFLGRTRLLSTSSSSASGNRDASNAHRSRETGSSSSSSFSGGGGRSGGGGASGSW